MPPSIKAWLRVYFFYTSDRYLRWWEKSSSSTRPHIYVYVHSQFGEMRAACVLGSFVGANTHDVSQSEKNPLLESCWIQLWAGLITLGWMGEMRDFCVSRLDFPPSPESSNLTCFTLYVHHFRVVFRKNWYLLQVAGELKFESFCLQILLYLWCLLQLNWIFCMIWSRIFFKHHHFAGLNFMCQLFSPQMHF